MKTDELDYYLPAELIAQQPSDVRSQSKLMVLDRREKSICGRVFKDVIEYLRAGDCLVLNDTRVLPARFYGHRDTGAKIEGLFLSQTPDGWEVMLKNSRKLKAGEEIVLCDVAGKDYCRAVAQLAADGQWKLKVAGDAEDVLAKIGFAPLPPYIKRNACDARTEYDRQRYQTVYARQAGAVAAPTAGLHFTDELLGQIESAGVKIAYVTLHVGAGTFKPVAVDNLNEHEIHSERFSVDEHNAEIINQARVAGGRIVAVGTTAVRTLETAAGEDGRVRACSGDTRLFIMPGYEYKIVGAMITNFHLPKSTLLALVGAFAGMDFVLQAYKQAVSERYRFYSYGDAMMIF
jgi:S-adenosylmethionine:tRNA ribosyltransferase-isomerase